MLQLYKNIKKRRIELNLTQSDLAARLGYADKSMIAKIEKGVVDLPQSKIMAFADALQVSPGNLMGWEPDYNIVANGRGVRIPVLGSVPAGKPIEAIEDIVDFEDIPIDWISGGREYFGLKVKGDSMYPKYIQGDTLIVRKQPDCESGQDCVVYVNGYDATLKKVIKKPDCIVLQPLNSEYEPKVYEYNDEEHPIAIAGVVVEIRRSV